MSMPAETIDVKVERTIPATPHELYDAWFNPEVPGTPWHEADELLLNPIVNGFFYWNFKGMRHYGRFTALERGARIRHTWMARSTQGWETTVTITFAQKGAETVMTLVHSGLPDANSAAGKEKGWNYFLGNFEKQFAK